MKKILILMIIIVGILNINTFAKDNYLNQTEVRLYFGKDVDFYVGTDVQMNLGDGIVIRADIKTNMHNSLSDFRFHPKKIIFGWGAKKQFDNFAVGYMTYCDHKLDIIIPYNTNDPDALSKAKDKIYNALSNPKHRFYIEI